MVMIVINSVGISLAVDSSCINFSKLQTCLYAFSGNFHS